MSPTNVTLPLKYLKQNLSPLLVPFFDHITLLDILKLLRNLENQLILLSHHVITDFMD